MKYKILIVKALGILLLSGCAQTNQAIHGVNSILGGVNSVLGAATGRSTGNYGNSGGYIGSGMPSAEQQKAISAAIKVPSNKATRQAVKEAKPNIEKLVAAASCQAKSWSDCANGIQGLGALVATNASLICTPGDFKYASQGQCVDVARVTDWKMPARNALQFKVMYVSKESGESCVKKVEMIKEGDEWLVNIHR